MALVHDYDTLVRLLQETEEADTLRSECLGCFSEIKKIVEEFEEINKALANIGRKNNSGDEDDSELIKRAEEIKQLKAVKKAEVLQVNAKYHAKLEVVHKLRGYDLVNRTKDVTIRSWGGKRTEPYLKNYADLFVLLGLAYRKEGGRSFILKGDGLRLSQALIKFGDSFLERRGYTSMQASLFTGTKFIKKCSQLAYFDEFPSKVTDKVDEPSSAYHLDEWNHPSQLPIRYAANSSCFREAGSNGNFERVEQFCLTKPNDMDSLAMQEEMLKNAECFYNMLNLPYEVVSIGSIDASLKAIRVQAWLPGCNEAIELVSCSQRVYQSRKIEILYKQEKAKHYAHLLNTTLTETERTMWCILENYQKEDGVEIPKVLQEYMGGQSFLPFLTEN